MADSATPRTADLSAATPCVAVAYSGGRDSTALLHATASAAVLTAQSGQGVRTVALHVHHGLSAQADAWQAHCEQQCRDWASLGLPIEFQHRRLLGAPATGQSVEAWARAGRYAALDEMARACGASILLLAHHRRDQAETFLLQALRGAGVAGLAGMPRQQLRAGLTWARPWLDAPREHIDAYVSAHGLRHIEDESNGDARYARNRLRLRLWPSLVAEFPQAERSLAQASAWSQQALALANEIGAEDVQRWSIDGSLQREPLLALSPARASNLLRAWLNEVLGHAVPATLVQRVLREASTADVAQWPLPGEGTLRLYRGLLRVEPASCPVSLSQPLAIDLSTPGRHVCAGVGGVWLVRSVDHGGVSPELLRQVQMRPRTGGEQFQAHARGLPRSLKKAWQSAGVDVFGRQGPLLFSAADLLWAPGLGFDARRLAAEGPQLTLDWLPGASA